jgi:hypothetical protein
MTMFTMCLDLAVHQAFCLYKAMLPNADQRNHKTILSFKEKIAQLLVNPVLQKNTAARCNPVLALTIACEAARNLSDTLGVIDKAHALVRNKPRKKGNMKTLLDTIKASVIAGKNRRKKSPYMGSLESL